MSQDMKITETISVVSAMVGSLFAPDWLEHRLVTSIAAGVVSAVLTPLFRLVWQRIFRKR